MAAPIGHIYLAVQLLAGPLQGVDERAFIVGTSFPDIRYLAHVPREYTHKPQVSWCDVLTEPDAFTAGMLFHGLVDDMRAEYFKHHDITRYALQKIGNPVDYLIKTAEDIILFSRLNSKLFANKLSNNKNFANYFDTILVQERALIHDENSIKKWHDSLKIYFSEGPTARSIGQLAEKNVGIKTAVFCQLSNILARVPDFRRQILGFYDNFETILANSFSVVCIRA